MKLENIPAIDIENASAPGNAPSNAPRHAAPAAPPAYGAHAAPAVSDALGSAPLDIPRRRSPKTIALVAAACVLVLVGAGVAVAAGLGVIGQKPQDEPVPVVEPPAPTTVKATVKADDVLILDSVLNRGDVLTNVQPATDLSGGFAETCYRASFAGKTVYVERSLVRTSAEAAFEPWTGYAAEDAIIYPAPDFSGDDILTLQLNEELTVVDAVGSLLFVCNVDGFEGYMPADKVMKEKVVVEVEQAPTYYYDYSYSGSSGSSSSGSGSNTGGFSTPSTPSDSSNTGGGSESAGDSGGGSSSGSGSDDAGFVSSDGEEINIGSLDDSEVSPTQVGFVPKPDPFLFGVGVAYADEAADADAETLSPEGEGAASGADASEAADQGVTAVVLMDGVQAYAGILNRGDEVTVLLEPLQDSPSADAEAQSESADDATLDDAQAVFEVSDVPAAPLGASDDDDAAESAESAEETYTIILNDQEAKLPKTLVRLASEPAYERWTGYALEGAVTYGDYRLTSDAAELEPNAQLDVVDAIGAVLVVEAEGKTRYMAAECAGEEPVKVEEEPEEEASEPEPASPSYSNGGSSWSGGSSSSGSSTPAPAPDPEPTPPPASDEPSDEGSGEDVAPPSDAGNGGDEWTDFDNGW